MAETKTKGDIGQSVIMARVMLAGYKVALPVGEDWRFDLIVYKDKRLIRVQCKYVESNGEVIVVPCRSSNNWAVKKYTEDEIDIIAVYDKTTDSVYYVPSSFCGKQGRASVSLRVTEPRNNQIRNVWYAKAFKSIELASRLRASATTGRVL